MLQCNVELQIPFVRVKGLTLVGFQMKKIEFVGINYEKQNHRTITSITCLALS